MTVWDPLHGMSWRTSGYAWLAVFFLRLAVWYALEDRWGKA